MGLERTESNEAKLQAAYVGVAVGVLGLPPPETDDEDRIKGDEALRDWAVRLLVDSSPVDPGSELEALLESGDSVFDFSTFDFSSSRAQIGLSTFPACTVDTDGDGLNDGVYPYLGSTTFTSSDCVTTPVVQD